VGGDDDESAKRAEAAKIAAALAPMLQSALEIDAAMLAYLIDMAIVEAETFAGEEAPKRSPLSEWAEDALRRYRRH
jgi:hypothetical protein